MIQPRLSLVVAQSTTLVTLDTARAVLGMDAESVTALCESGRLAYAFDLAAAPNLRREIRIWTECLQSYQAGIQLPQDDDSAIESIVGHSYSEWIACSQVAQRFCIHRRTVYRWSAAGEVLTNHSGNVVHVLRNSLTTFLQVRRIR